MANQRKVGLKIEIDGEKEYKQAISELNKGNQVLASELKLVSEQYRGNEESIEALTAKGDVLQRQLQQQEDKVKTLQAALQNAAEKYGEADKRTQNLQIQLNNAQREELRLKSALDETNKSLDSQGEKVQEGTKKMAGLGDTINSVAGNFGNKLPSGVTKALNSIDGFSVATVAKMSAVAAAVAAAVKAVKELYDATIEAAARADELLTKSVITGVDTQTLQQWQYAAEFIDVSVETMTGSMTKLTNSAYDAANGNEKLAATFASLGVSVTDSSGQLLPAEEIFYDVVDALGQVQNQTERDAIAMDLLGRSAQELNPLIDQGSEALRGYSEEAEEAGYVLDEYQLAKLAEVDDAYQKWQLQLEATKYQLAVAFAPIAEAALKGVTAVVNVLTNALEKMNEMAEKAARAFKSLLGQKSEMQSYGIGSDVYGATWKDDVQAYVTMGGTVITPDIIDQIDKTTGKPKNNFYLGEILPGEAAYSYGHMDEEDIQRLLAGHNAAGTDNWRGGLTWVGEAGPELVALPRGSQIYSNQESRSMAGVNIGTVVIEARTIRELNDLVRIFQGAQIEGRMS